MAELIIWYIDDKNRIHIENTLGTSLTPKKISGHAASGILNDQFCSRIAVFCDLFRCEKTEALNETMYLNAGKIIEHIIFDYWNKLHGNFWLQYPEDCFEKYNQFNDSIFGGLQDGIVSPLAPNTTPFIEIKTCAYDSFVWEEDEITHQKHVKKANKALDNGDYIKCPVIKTMGTGLNKFFDNKHNLIVPLDYWYQIGLYMYLSNNYKATLVVSFLSPYDYIYPEKFQANSINTHSIDIDSTPGEIDSRIIKPLKKFHNEYLTKAISWVLSDAELVWCRKWLKNEKKIDGTF